MRNVDRESTIRSLASGEPMRSAAVPCVAGDAGTIAVDHFRRSSGGPKREPEGG
jgi:hypothetical protein